MGYNRKRILYFGILPVLMVFMGSCLTGCDKQVSLYGRLEEEQANEILAILMQRGISCAKSAGEENTWSVSVSTARFSDAVTLVKEAGLPRETFSGVGEVFKKSGMVSSPMEDRIRFMYALSQDLSATLTKIDGVVSARVHIVLPENDPFKKEFKPSSASVFIKYRYDADIESRAPFIKNLVMDSIEGLQYDKISLVFFRGDPPSKIGLPEAGAPAYASVLGIEVMPGSVFTLWIAVGVAGALLAAAFAGCAILGWRFYQQKPVFKPSGR